MKTTPLWTRAQGWISAELVEGPKMQAPAWLRGFVFGVVVGGVSVAFWLWAFSRLLRG